jgi:hypothetical protein
MNCVETAYFKTCTPVPAAVRPAPANVVGTPAATDESGDAMVTGTTGASVAGTTWTFGGMDKKVTFGPDGTTSGSCTKGGHWQQTASHVAWDCNNYTHYDVTMNGDQLTGTWRNERGLTGGTKLQRSTGETHN